MKTSLLAFIASLALTGASHAALVVTVPAAIDETIFDSQPHGLLGAATIGGMTFSGGALVEQGVSGNGQTNWAIPGVHNALVVGGGQTETVTFDHPQTDLLIAWDSADDYNGVVFNNGVEITGQMLADWGFRVTPYSDPAANLLLDFSGFGTPYTSATFYSLQDSFEFVVNNDGAAVPTPEISTLMMMGLGFAGLVFAASRQARLTA